MVDPEPELAPVMPPVIVPIVQVNVLGVLAVKLIFVPVPLHIVAVEEFVTDGAGFTVTVMVKELPIHEPAVEVGVTIYCTDPAEEVLELISISLIVVPEPEFAPVMLPTIVPTVHEKLLGIFAVRVILGPVPLHVVAEAEFVTTGIGFIVTVNVLPGLAQPFASKTVSVPV